MDSAVEVIATRLEKMTAKLIALKILNTTIITTKNSQGLLQEET